MTALLAPAFVFGFLAAALGHAWLVVLMRPLHSAADTLVFSAYLTAGALAVFLALHLALAAATGALRWDGQRALRLRAGMSASVISAALLAASFIVLTRPFYLRQAGDLLGFTAMLALGAAIGWISRGVLARALAHWGRSLLACAGAFLLPLLAYLAGGEARHAAAGAELAAAPRPSEHVFVLGFDGATWDVMRPLMEAGRLPNFQRVVEQGASGTLWSEVAPNQPFQNSASRGMRTPVIWETICTGRSPRDHAVWDFYTTPVPGLSHPFPFRLPRLRQRSTLSIDGLEPRLWELSGAAAIESLVVGWVDTWPAFESHHCQLVSDRAHWHDHALTWPEHLELQHSALFTLLPEFARAEGRELSADYIGELVRRLDGELMVPRHREVARDVLGLDFDPEYETKFTREQPQYWRHRLVHNQSKELTKDLFYFDSLQRLLEEARAGDGIPRLVAFYTSGTDTVQHWFWQFHDPQSYRDADPGLTAELGPVIARVYENADRMLGEILDLAGAGATVVICSDHGAGAWTELFGGWDPFRSGEAHDGYSGNHRANGVFLAMGPGIRPGFAAPDLSIYDLTPLILHLLGLPVAENMPGRVPEELFDDEFRGQNPVRMLPDFGRRQLPANARALAKNAGDEVLNARLSDLGYAEGVTIEDQGQ